MTDNGASEPSLTMGAMASPEGMLRLIGDRAKRIHPKAYHYLPFGYRIMVLPDEVPLTTTSGLVLPDSVREVAQITMGAGVVMAVGPLVGQHIERVPHPGGILVSDPRALLYQHVLFAQHAGAYLQMFFTGRKEWDQIPVMLTDRDLWIADDSPPSEWGPEL